MKNIYLTILAIVCFGCGATFAQNYTFKASTKKYEPLAQGTVFWRNDTSTRAYEGSVNIPFDFYYFDKKIEAFSSWEGFVLLLPADKKDTMLYGVLTNGDLAYEVYQQSPLCIFSYKIETSPIKKITLQVENITVQNPNTYQFFRLNYQVCFKADNSIEISYGKNEMPPGDSTLFGNGKGSIVGLYRDSLL